MLMLDRCINVRVFQVVFYMLDVFIKLLSRQIEHQQPVYLIDTGREIALFILNLYDAQR